ncbi:MAG: DUF6851 domain-containing protein, partial [Pseudomonadota bacterium]
GGSLDFASGGRGFDTIDIKTEAGAFDIEIEGRTVTLIDRFSGAETVLRGIEQFDFNDRSFDFRTLVETFGPDAPLPEIQVGGGTQVVTINDPDPTVSVIWDRVVQQAVIDTDVVAVGPTVAARAYAMLHTAMYDAWATYDPTAVRVSFDEDGNNAGFSALAELANTDANKAKAMSYAAVTVLEVLFPDQGSLLQTVMEERLGFSLESDGSLEAQIGIDAAEDLLALRTDDGSNQAGT